MALPEFTATRFKVKVARIGPSHRGPLGVLSRSIRSRPDSIVYESDHRQAHRLVEELELTPEIGGHDVAG